MARNVYSTPSPKRLCFGLLGPIALAVAIVAVALFLFDSAFGTAIAQERMTASQTSDAQTPVSTPASQWHKGEMPFLFQTDGAWAGADYGGGTIGTHGCGPTSLSMAYIYLTGKKDKDPQSMADFSTRGGYLDQGATSWSLMTEGAQQLGLSSQELTANVGAVRTELAAGHPIICSMGPGDFTDSGHFILLTRTRSDGSVEIRDPNSAERSARYWNLDRILGQCRNLWTLQAA